MEWLYINEASEKVGKSTRTIRSYLQKYKGTNPNLKPENNIFRYEVDSNNNKKLQVSDIFLQTYFNAEFHPMQNRVEEVAETIAESIANNNEKQSIDLEQKYDARVKAMEVFYEKQLNEVKQSNQQTVEAKQQTIDLLQKQLDKADYNLNKILEANIMAQLTIQNLTQSQSPTKNYQIQATETAFKSDLRGDNTIEDINIEEQEITLKKASTNQLDIVEEIEKIVQEQQKPKGLRTTAEYFKPTEPTEKEKSFNDWLKKL